MSLVDRLNALLAEAHTAFLAAEDETSLEAARSAILGRNGSLKELQQAFKEAPAEEKRSTGKVLGEVTAAIREAHNQRQVALQGADDDDDAIDITLPAESKKVGSIHPISQVAAEVEAVFTSMGFDVIDGPHVESDEFNFTRLNIPEDHPARDSQDTFWLKTGKLLRTHTSAVQSRTYPAVQPPFRKVVVGKVFRYEEVDATHDNTFTQVEGFLVDKDINVAHLKGTLETMITAVLKRDDIEIRLRPSFFPFVVPGFEVDVRSTAPDAGKFSKWIELLGCGMIHPDVLRQGGIDPDQYQGFAFGLGLERLTMIRHGIDDIRLFNGADLRGLHQFGA